MTITRAIRVLAGLWDQPGETLEKSLPSAWPDSVTYPTL
jgi:hypothetical protein